MRPPPSKARLRIRVPRVWHVYAGALIVAMVTAVSATGIYYYLTFSNVIDARLLGERTRVLPRVFARPFELRAGQSLTEGQLIERLNDLGYEHRPRLEGPGNFSVGRRVVALIPRQGELHDRPVRVHFTGRPQTEDGAPGGTVARLEVVGGSSVSRLQLDPAMLSGLVSGDREKRRRVALATIAPRMIQAVLAIEDRRFYSHPGVDPIRMVGALFTNLRGDLPYLVGASTITQQLVKNFFLTPEKSIRRKLLEQFMAIVLERRASKDEILELYLNEVYLGQRGSFAVRGVAEAARVMFAKDVSNLSLAEAATIAGVIQAPSEHSPFRSPARARERRNVVLNAMADSGFVTEEAAERASLEPLIVSSRAIDTEAPYFVDFIADTLAASHAGVYNAATRLDVYTTLDLHLQRIAQDAVREGTARIDRELASRRRTLPPVQAALLAVDPRTGDILAMTGGRSYSQSQYNRATQAHRQPGSVFKPFVYLAAFERAAADSRADITPATLVSDAPTRFHYEDKEYTPANFAGEYDGPITLRRALALSRNVATVRLAEKVGYQEVARLWRRIDRDGEARPYPSIALGVFETTPLSMAESYTLFANGGRIRALGAITRIDRGDAPPIVPKPRASRRIARRDTTYLVTNMMQSVMDEGTGIGARTSGFRLAAAGKSGSTNDLRDGWFVGFTPSLLTVVWVGFDDNQPLGLTGAQAALPIWTAFMQRALAGRASVPFAAPDGVIHVPIDRDTGLLAVPGCPRVMNEAFLDGTAPTETCEFHRF
jgi:penicillin-binding protein 1B